MAKALARAGPMIAVVGMVREARILAGEGVTVIIGGGDSAALEARLVDALARGATGTVEASARLLSFGVCGALSAGFKAGDVLLGAAVIGERRRWDADAGWLKALSQILPRAIPVEIAAGDAMIGSVTAKRALFEATGAAAVDMESHVVARIAERYGATFAVVRAVSDTAEHTLPPAALAGLRADGRADIGAVLRALARRPGQLPALLRTAASAEAAFRALQRLPSGWAERSTL